MGQWKNGKYHLDNNGQIPVLSEEQISNISTKVECIFKNKEDNELYKVDKNNVITPITTNIPKTVFISSTGSDTTGLLESGKKPFRTFNAAYAAILNRSDRQGWTVEYINPTNSAIITYTEEDTTVIAVELTIKLAKFVYIQSLSDNDTPLFHGNIYCSIIGGFGSKLLRAGSPTNGASCLVGFIHIEGFSEIRSTSLHAIQQPYHIPKIKNCTLIQADTNNAIHYGNYGFTPTIENCKILSLTDIGIRAAGLTGKFTNCVIEGETATLCTWQLELHAYNCDFIVRNGYANITNCSYNHINNTELYNCRFYNYYDNPTSTNIHRFVGDSGYFKMHNVTMWKLNTDNPVANNLMTPYDWDYPREHIKTCEFINVVCNAGMNMLTETSGTEKYAFFVKDDANIVVGDVYDMYMSNNYTGNATLHSKVIGGTPTPNPYFTQISYTVQAGDTKIDILTNLKTLWEQEVINGNELFLGGGSGFDLEITNVYIGYPHYANFDVLLITGRTIYDLFPRGLNVGSGVVPDQSNFRRVAMKWAMGWLNTIDVNNIKDTIIVHKNLNKDNNGKFGENNVIKP